MHFRGFNRPTANVAGASAEATATTEARSSYNDPPALLNAHFSGGASSVFVGPDGELHGVARDSGGKPVRSAADARRMGLSPLAIQPQVTPLVRGEKYLTDETIRRGEGTYLAPKHFRNQLYRANPGTYKDFKAMAEETWPGLQLRGLEGYSPLHPIGRLNCTCETVTSSAR